MTKAERIARIENLNRLAAAVRAAGGDVQNLYSKSKCKFYFPGFGWFRGIMVFGNKKISNRTAIVNLPAIDTCPGCSACYHIDPKTGEKVCDCYAIKAQRMYPTCAKAWTRNKTLADMAPRFFVAVVNYQLALNNAEYCRMHSSGDFYNAAYAELWIEIAAENPAVKFWTYTKSAGYYSDLDAALIALDSMEMSTL